MKRFTAVSLILLVTLGCQDALGPTPQEPLQPSSAPVAQQATASLEQMDVVFGPRRFDRAHGQPVLETVSIPVDRDSYEQSYRLYVRNGDESGLGRTSSARVTLNGEQLFGPSAFSLSVPQLSADIQLGAASTLGVQISSNSGSHLTIWIEGRRA